MKKMSKLTKKLFLSAIALGLAVVTLTTTTFAWYTSSTQAAAQNGSASTSSTTADSSLLISADGITFNSTATIEGTPFKLVPLQYKEEAFRLLDGNVYTEKSGESGVPAGFYSFTLYFKSNNDEEVDVYIQSLKIANTIRETANLPKYDSLNYAEDATNGIPNQSTYAVDVVNALDLIIENNRNGFFNYDLSGQIDGVVAPFGFDEGNKPNAINYYNAFMETDLSANQADKLVEFTTATPIGRIPTSQTNNGILQVTFILYLNGWDNYCFDACRGQSFNVNIDFTTVPQGVQQGQ